MLAFRRTSAHGWSITDADGQATFEVSTETHHTDVFDTADPVEFSFTEGANGNSATDTLAFEAGEPASLTATKVTSSTMNRQYAGVDLTVEDEFGNEADYEVEVDLSTFAGMKEPTSEDTYTTSCTWARFLSDENESGIVTFTEASTARKRPSTSISIEACDILLAVNGEGPSVPQAVGLRPTTARLPAVGIPGLPVRF